MILSKEEYVNKYGIDEFYSIVSTLYHKAFKITITKKDIDSWSSSIFSILIENNVAVALARYKYIFRKDTDINQKKYIQLVEKNINSIIYLSDLLSVHSGAGKEILDYLKKLSSVIVLRAHNKELIPYYSNNGFTVVEKKPYNVKGNIMLYGSTPVDTEEINIFIGDITMGKFRKKTLTEFIPWSEDLDMTGVSVSDADKELGSPKVGDMIGVNPNNPEDRWLVSADVFNETYEEVIDITPAADDATVITDVLPTDDSIDTETFAGRFNDALKGIDREEYDIAYTTIEENDPDEVIEGVLNTATEAIAENKPMTVLTIPGDIYMQILNDLLPVYRTFKDGIEFPIEDFNWSTNDTALQIRDRLIEQIGTVVKTYVPTEQKAIFVEYIPSATDYFIFIVDDANSVYDLVFNAKYADNDIVLTIVPYDKVDKIAQKIN